MGGSFNVPKAPRFHESEIVSASPLHDRSHTAIRALTSQLPMRILGAIEQVKLLATVDSVENMQGNFRYVVEFKGGRKLEFANADTFPTEADVARVALECP